MKNNAGQSWGYHPLVLYKITVRSVIECASDCHMGRLERIQWGAGQICFGLMRYTHVLSVEVLAGLPSIKQRLSFLNKMFLVTALVKPND
jgi:hypothetical protein